MIASWVVVAAALVYLLLLFAVAHWGDRGGRRLMQGRARSSIYALGLAAYCTSWTFYGSVGLASRSGLDFLTNYIGPILVIGLGWPLVAKVVRIAKAQNITSVADFVAARYGKSEQVAAVVSLIAIVGALPYIALQLEAVSASLGVFLAGPLGGTAARTLPMIGDLPLVVALVFAGFAVAFGTRHADATEHQNGLVLAVAVEGVFKLAAFLVVGLFVVFWMFDGVASILARLPGPDPAERFLRRTSDGPTIVTLILLSACATLLLPRQFHMVVVENRAVGDVRRAAWSFPLYLIAINLFVAPIALAGFVVFPEGAIDRDMTVLDLPLHAGAGAVALVTFLGGLSAAAAMVILESIAVAIMISNHLVLPILLRRRRAFAGAGGIPPRDDLGGWVLGVRRVAILALILLSYLYYRAAGEAELAAFGLLSLAAVAQIAPAFIGALVWSRGTAAGAIAGLIAGFAVWFYTLLLPSMLRGASPLLAVLTEGPWGLEALRPTALLGVQLPVLTHGVVWSLGVNIAFLVAVSLIRPASALERLQAVAFTDVSRVDTAPGFRLFGSAVPVDDVKSTVARYLGEARTRHAFAAFARSRRVMLDGRAEADTELLRHAEHLLASAIGAASSRLAISILVSRRDVSKADALQLLDDASAALTYNRDLLQHALDHTSQGIAVFDRGRKLICWNRAVVDIHDLPPDLMHIGAPLDALIRFNAERGLYGPGSVDVLAAERARALSPGGDPVRVRHFPAERVIEIRSNGLPDGGFITTYTDVSDTVAEEEERERQTELLELRVLERTEELVEANEALSALKAEADAANMSKTRFLAAASHDLLQPLNAARLYASSLVERDREGGDAALAENIDASLDAVEEILTALIDISRLDAGALKPDWTRFRVDEILKQLQREFEPIAKERGLEITFVRTSVTVHSDRRLLRRLVQNLISNAIKYTKAGGVLVGARRRGYLLSLEVWDTGIGIPASKQKAVFQEFHRLAEGGSVAHGLGLGLSIVERIGRVLNAEVTLASVPGQGSMFAVKVPIAAAAAVPVETAKRVSSLGAPLAGLYVMVIDNEPAILDAMRGLLTRWGCTMITARSVAEAMVAGAQKPDVIVADYHLDEGNGLDGIRTVRRRFRADLPAVLLTADRSPKLIDEAASLGVTVLHKPLKPAALRALLSQWRSTRVAAE